MSSPYLKHIACILLLIMTVGAGAGRVSADVSTPRSTAPVKIYFFCGNGCPHCEREKDFLSVLRKQHPELVIESYEVWQNRANAGFFTQMTEHAGIRSTGVPVTFIGNKVFV